MTLEIAIPDSGPLISLGRLNRLDLLDRFNCPILVTDMVADEVLRGLPGAPDAQIFKNWFDTRGNYIQTVETSMGILWKELSEKPETLRRIKDAGETSIWQFSNSLKETMSGNDFGLVLFEDNRIKAMDFGDRIAKLTTWSFFVGLERKEIIPSAESMHQSLINFGRLIAKDPFEAKARLADPNGDWTDGVSPK